MHFDFNNQFIKVENIGQNLKNNKICYFFFILVSGIMNLYVNRIPDIKKIFSFDDFE